MKRCFLLAFLCILVALGLPLLLRRLLLPPAASPAEAPAAETAAVAPPPPAASADSRLILRARLEGAAREITMEEYLPGVLAGEMPAVFAPEALRAQAVAARTYALRERSCPAHPEEDVCDDAGCCQVWLSEEALRRRWGDKYGEWVALIRAAVADTDGQILTWEDEPILACFHASSPGQTEGSAALWGTALPYLVSVDTPETEEDVPDFVTEVEIDPAEFREILLRNVPGCDLSALPAEWIGERTVDAAGRVAFLRLGGAAVAGSTIRQLFSLRSACFTLEWTGHSFLFTVTGSGHGVGMSQYGANVLARQGWSYADILAHYYPGAVLTQAPLPGE